jgi:hypothetical protein
MNIPENYQSQDAPFTYDQGESSMCCACAYSFVRYLQESEQSGLTDRFAPAYIYANRDADEMYEGMDIRSCMKHGQASGDVLWEELPYFGTLGDMIAKYNEKKDLLVPKAEPFIPSSYYCCFSRVEVQAAIMSTKAVIIGVPIYNNFYQTKDGMIDYVKGMEFEGGHAIALYGWKMINGKFYWLMKNSWSDTWGNNGSAYLSGDYPWLANAWAVIDKRSEMTYKEYRQKFYSLAESNSTTESSSDSTNRILYTNDTSMDDNTCIIHG